MFSTASADGSDLLLISTPNRFYGDTAALASPATGAAETFRVRYKDLYGAISGGLA